MLASYQWLKEYCECTLSPEEAAEKLTALGLEVKEIRKVRSPISGLVIGKVLEAARHPNADRLKVTRVETKSGTLPIVCGAANVAAGQMVLVATVGAKLPGGLEIGRAKIRGVESEGMICSRSELGLEKESDGIWVLPESASLTEDPAVYIGPEDAIFDFDLTSNRPDCLSILGLAQELAVISSGYVSHKKHKKFVEKMGTIPIQVIERDLCPRYSARLIQGIKIGPSPDWLQDRLRLHELRPINNVVDITNLILLEYGQPLHAFDFKKLGGGAIVVRKANPGETLQILDGKNLTLTPDDLVIADTSKAVALAGVMGGAASGVTDGTQDILLEAACFDPKTVRQTSKRHKISTDSSIRFEKGISIDRVEEALAYAVELILELAGGNLGSSAVDVYSHKPKDNLVFFRYATASTRLGVEIDSQKINKIFTSLGFQVKYHDQTKAQLLIPNARKDISEEWDLLEEVARIYGYGELPEAIPSVANAYTRIRAAALGPIYAPALALGYQEAVNYSFADNRVLEKIGASSEGLIPLQNPVSPDFARLRGTLLYGLLENVKHNQEHLRRASVRFFEVGRVFHKQGDRFSEQKKIAFILAGPAPDANWISPEREMDYYDLSGDLESYLRALGLGEVTFQPFADPDFASGISAQIFCGSKVLGRAGQLHATGLAKLSMEGKKVFFAEIDLDELLVLTNSLTARFQPYSPYPAVARDLAFVMGRNENIRAVENAIRAHSPLIHSVGIADVYTGDKIAADKKSVVFGVQYQSMEKTFTSAELDGLEKSLIQKLTQEFPISLR